EDGIRDFHVTGVQTCALPILGNHSGNDVPVIRYADILLSRAEALNELNGPTQEALDLINEVRNRAGLADLTLADASGKEVLRDQIGRASFRERLYICDAACVS